MEVNHCRVHSIHFRVVFELSMLHLWECYWFYLESVLSSLCSAPVYLFAIFLLSQANSARICIKTAPCAYLMSQDRCLFCVLQAGLRH